MQNIWGRDLNTGATSWFNTNSLIDKWKTDLKSPGCDLWMPHRRRVFSTDTRSPNAKELSCGIRGVMRTPAGGVWQDTASLGVFAPLSKKNTESKYSFTLAHFCTDGCSVTRELHEHDDSLLPSPAKPLAGPGLSRWQRGGSNVSGAEQSDVKEVLKSKLLCPFVLFPPLCGCAPIGSLHRQTTAVYDTKLIPK